MHFLLASKKEHSELHQHIQVHIETLSQHQLPPQTSSLRSATHPLIGKNTAQLYGMDLLVGQKERAFAHSSEQASSHCNSLSPGQQLATANKFGSLVRIWCTDSAVCQSFDLVCSLLYDYASV